MSPVITRHVTEVFTSVVDYLAVGPDVIPVSALITRFFQVFPSFPISRLPNHLMVAGKTTTGNDNDNSNDTVAITNQITGFSLSGFSLSGYAGSGKSTVANVLTEEFGYTAHAFAAALKDITAYLFDLDRALLEGDTSESRKWREQPLADWPDDEVGSNDSNDSNTNSSGSKAGLKPVMTARLVLQLLGTEVFRSLCDDIWLKVLTSKLIGRVVITDARFVNELQLCQQLGLQTLVVRRPGVGPQSSHPSETSHTQWQFDVTIDNGGSLQQLTEAVGQLVNRAAAN